MGLWLPHFSGTKRARNFPTMPLPQKIVFLSPKFQVWLICKYFKLLEKLFLKNLFLYLSLNRRKNSKDDFRIFFKFIRMMIKSKYRFARVTANYISEKAFNDNFSKKWLWRSTEVINLEKGHICSIFKNHLSTDIVGKIEVFDVLFL